MVIGVSRETASICWGADAAHLTLAELLAFQRRFGRETAEPGQTHAQRTVVPGPSCSR
jgi:hypothetical protein